MWGLPTFGSFEVPKIFVPEEHWRDFSKADLVSGPRRSTAVVGEALVRREG